MKSFHKQFILTIFVVVCFCILLSSVIYGAVEDRENYSISYSYAKSDGNLQDFDSTDRHIFFACWNTSSVDVFNVDGAFEFSISFTDYQNGGIYLRAHDNFMYIMKKYQVFSGEPL